MLRWRPEKNDRTHWESFFAMTLIVRVLLHLLRSSQHLAGKLMGVVSASNSIASVFGGRLPKPEGMYQVATLVRI